MRYRTHMIKGFADKETERIFRRNFSRKLPRNIQVTAYRKLLQIHAATELATLRIPPANRLEKLSGDRAGQHSIRINRQWRICFRWRVGHADDVEIVDYQ